MKGPAGRGQLQAAVEGFVGNGFFLCILYSFLRALLLDVYSLHVQQVFIGMSSSHCIVSLGYKITTFEMKSEFNAF